MAQLARAIGDYTKPVVGVRPLAAQAASAVNGPAIDRAGFNSCEVIGYTGADTGAPTARTLACKLQDSADGSTGWADLTGGAVPDVTAINSEARLSFDLAKTIKQFIRIVHTVSFTAGTSPTLFIGSVVILGGARTLPT